ncbi:MAG: BREX-4 system phosphatase PglZ [Desulfobacterales bacterium]|nr:BREX-4 system phosphatase PglZ [Desulfobacterales bacterium]
MIKIFNSIDELRDEITTDKKDHSPFEARYPLRLILCNNMESFREIIKFLSSLNIILLHLNSLLPYEDGWLTPDDIVNAVKSQTEDATVFPLSELIRFFSDSDFNALLTTLFEIENSSINFLKRIYVPILGLKERFEKIFFNRFHRKDKGAPIWYLEDIPKEKINICYYCFEVKLSCSFKIMDTCSWLDIWKHDITKDIICTSKTMGYLFERFLPDRIFQMKKIDTYKEYLINNRELTIPFEYKKEEANFWKILAEDMEKHENFQKYIHEHFNINKLSKISKDELLKLWLQKKDKYSKWLLTYWIISQDYFINSYLFDLLSVIKDFSDDELIEQIWLKIFDDNTTENHIFNERKAYLNIIHNEYKYPFHQIEEKLQKKILSISDKSFNVQADYLTNITFSERKYLVESFKNADEENMNICKQSIQILYPELFYYLEWNIQLDNQTSDYRIAKYFKEYNLAKALNKKSDELDALINELNKNADAFYKWYYEIDTICDYHKGSQIIWIDALGAEWLPLLEYLINFYGKEKNKFVEKKYICKSNLPSITECNRFENAVHILELDEYIHKKPHYIYPDDLIFQIQLLKDIVKKEIIESNYKNITVVSDHGFTFLAQKRFGNIKKFNFSESHHEGRCMWTDKTFQNDSEFISHVIDSGNCKGKKALIALKHNSLNDTPSREVHGGATPEEVLVSCLNISQSDNIINYNVEVLTKKVSTQNPKIAIAIEPHPTSPPQLRLKLENKLFPIMIEGDQWFSDLKGLKPGTYIFDLSIHNQNFKFEIFVYGGMKETELF